MSRERSAHSGSFDSDAEIINGSDQFRGRSDISESGELSGSLDKSGYDPSQSASRSMGTMANGAHLNTSYGSEPDSGYASDTSVIPERQMSKMSSPVSQTFKAAYEMVLDQLATEKRHNDILSLKNETFAKENEELKSANQSLQQKNVSLQQDNERLLEEVLKKSEELMKLHESVALMQLHKPKGGTLKRRKKGKVSKRASKN